jgi:hypothetical protein
MNALAGATHLIAQLFGEKTDELMNNFYQPPRVAGRDFFAKCANLSRTVEINLCMKKGRVPRALGSRKKLAQGSGHLIAQNAWTNRVQRADIECTADPELW